MLACGGFMLYSDYDYPFSARRRVRVTAEQNRRLQRIAGDHYQVSVSDLFRKALEKGMRDCRRARSANKRTLTLSTPDSFAKTAEAGGGGAVTRTVRLTDEQAWMVRKAAADFYQGDLGAMARDFLEKYLDGIDRRMSGMSPHETRYYMHSNYNW